MPNWLAKYKHIYLIEVNNIKMVFKETHKFRGFSQTSLWKNSVMAISNSPQPHSDNSNGGDSTTLVGLLKLECNWKTTRFITTPRSSLVAPRTYTVHLCDWYLITHPKIYSYILNNMQVFQETNKPNASQTILTRLPSYRARMQYCHTLSEH